MFKKTLAALVICGAMASPASASLFMIDNGVDFGSNGSTSTTAISELGYTGTMATSIYLGNPAVAGTNVIDTNIASVMNSYGFSAGVHTMMDGGSQEFFYPGVPDNLNVNALNKVPSVTDKNGFSDGESVAYGTGGTWGLTYDYLLKGVTTASSVQYNDGYFDVFYQNGGVAKQVLRLKVTGSNIGPANLYLTGMVTFDFDGNGSNDALGDSFVQNMFIDALTGKSFYELWLANPTGNPVTWIVDTNVNPPLPTLDQLWQTSVDGPLVRQSTLDGSIRFAVPEPTSVALLGLGLLGLGLSRKSKKSNV